MSDEFFGVDGAIWGVETKREGNEDRTNVVTTAYRFKNKSFDDGHETGISKYIVLTIKAGSNSIVEFMRARIGDVNFFINNQARAGWHGIMIKDGCVPTNTVKEMFRRTLNNYKVANSHIINDVMAQV